MHGFLLNMWIMNRVDEVYLQGQVLKGRITQIQFEVIITTEQLIE